MLRSWMLGGLCAVALASASASWGGIVETRDGRTIEGEVTEQGDQVFIDRHGMRFSIDRADIKSISLGGSIKDEYTRRHDKLTMGDVRGRLDLARWLLDKKEYDLARQVLAEARAFSSYNPDVIAMQHTVDRQQDLNQMQARKRAPIELAAAGDGAAAALPAAPPMAQPPAAAPGAAPAAAAPAATQPASTRPADWPIRPLSADEINLIRQGEYNTGEPIRATFKGDVRRQYATSMQQPVGDFMRLAPAVQAASILKDGTPEQKAGVTILQDPVSINQYKILQRSVISMCATCHTNGKTTSRFALVWPTNNDNATYANFLILSNFSTKIGDREYRMIDRANPNDSLLLLYSAPPGAAARGTPAHPPVDGKYKGIPVGERRFQSIQQWLSQSLNPSTPDYSTIQVGPASSVTPLPAPKK